MPRDEELQRLYRVCRGFPISQRPIDIAEYLKRLRQMIDAYLGEEVGDETT